MSVPEVVLSLCRDFGELDALMALDCGLHRGLVTQQDLDRVTDAPRRGVATLRRVRPRADGRSESAWETVLREFHRVVGAPVTPQYEVRDEHGMFVARGDLRVDGTQVLHEYDGACHLGVEQQRHDLRRHRRLTAAGWVRRGFTAEDLVGRAVSVLRDVDDSLGRPHEPGRISAWHRLLVRSALTPAGRATLADRCG